MPKQLEKSIEIACVKIAEGHGMISFKLDKVQRGWPDRMFLGPAVQNYDGALARVWFVEFKRPGYRPRDQQQWRHEKLATLGYDVSVITSIEQFRAALLEQRGSQ